jgi:hypothetical protein
MNTNYGRPGCKPAVWAKLEKIKGKSPDIWRKDSSGHILQYTAHGKSTSKYGWDIDHIIPKAQCGSDNIENLQALHYSINRACGSRIDKPGLDPLFLHNMRKQILYDRISKCHIKIKLSQIKVGKMMYVKTSPITQPALANILSIDKVNKKVIVKWIFANNKEEVIYDSVLFEEIGNKRIINVIS